MSTIALRRVSKVFRGGIEALRGIDLEVASGELLAIVGPSGSGKSTLLRVVAGLEAPSGGEVWIGGRRADGRAPEDRDTAMVFQVPALYPHLNVFDNLAFGARAGRVAASEIRRRVGAAADSLGLTGLLDRPPRALSGGERQRVALGRAIARRPAILLLDEPFSGLDAPLRAAVRADLVGLHRRLGTTTIHVTHDQAEAMALGDRVAVLDRGRVLQHGPPLEVYDRPATRAVAEFIGSPPMNVLPCAIRGDGAALRVELLDLPAAPVFAPPSADWSAALVRRGEGRVDLGLRPEQIQPASISASDGSALVVEAMVHRVEPLGHELLTILALGPHRLAVRWSRAWPTAPGAAIAVALDLARASWFDPESGGRLS